MTARGRISAFQFFCTVFVCRIIALFTFIITDKNAFPPGDRSVIFLPFLLAGLLAFLPTVLITGKNEDRTIFTLTDRVHPNLSRGIGLLYTAGAVWSAGMSLVRFDLFMSTVMFSGAKLWGFILFLIAAAVLVALRGPETVARMSVPVLALLAASLIYVCVTTGKEFDAANLDPPLLSGVLPLVKNGYSAVARTSEMAALLVTAPRINGGIKKGIFFWLLTFGVTVSAVYTLISGVTGAYGERQMFQLYALTVLSKLGVIERLDALICAIWVLCSLTRLAVYIMTAGMFLEGGFHIAANAKTYIGICLPIAAVYFALSGSVTSFSKVLASGVNEYVFTGLLIVIPPAVLLAERIKRKVDEIR